MNINWKVRLKNPVFWLTIIPAVIALVYTAFGLLGIVPTISEDTLINAITMVISALTAIGVLVDPTTKGVGDSERALGYNQLGGDSEDMIEDEDDTTEAKG